VYALGGVDAGRAADCAAAGADGVAVIRCLFDAARPDEVAAALAAPFRAARSARRV
jgi:thiamine-phosphate pyrophosphorylase